MAATESRTATEGGPGAVSGAPREASRRQPPQPAWNRRPPGRLPSRGSARYAGREAGGISSGHAMVMQGRRRTRPETRRPKAPALPARLCLAALPALVLLATPALAQREDEGLQLNCANDYFRLCVGVDPSSPEADKCMLRNRKRLSAECRAAISAYDRKTGSRSLQDD